MNISKIFLLVYLLIGTAHGFAQGSLPLDSAFLKAVEKGTRTMNGVPGAKYWQNAADYKLKVQFEPKTRLLKGTAEIYYHNNSPDTLREVWFKLNANIYKEGVARKSKIDKKDLGDGVRLKKIAVAEKALETNKFVVNGTNMKIVDAEVLPNSETLFKIDYEYTLNEGSHLRTGKVDDGAYFVAYFFPRIAVYDDIDGWNEYPYTGAEEFYNDFCDFEVEIEVPRGYAVWATGDLKNGKKVYQKHVNDSLKAACISDSVIDIIGEEDIKSNAITKGKAANVFKFEAKQVVDFAFALSNHYVWKSVSLVVDSATARRTRVDAVYDPSHKDYSEVIDFARKTVEGMSFHFPAWPFPYSHMTVFDGLDQMEYPMMANDNPTKNREDAITLTSHEIFHTMFPFFMGTNETKYAWMDEGWATIGEWKLSKYIDSTYVDDYGIQPTAKNSGSPDDAPINTLTTELEGAATFTNSYPKPALGYLYIEEYLGQELFQKALHYYIKTWQGKHPQPLDFFYAMNAGSGQNLDWFWKRWFYEDGVLDLAIHDVVKSRADEYAIIIKNKSMKPLPIHLTVYYSDGSKEKLDQSIEVWREGDKTVTLPLITKKKIKLLELGDTYVPDKNKQDNVFKVN
ncbi:M1 family metallopeptidase [Olivibacter sp. XZL3]|uniref:M1 family metallopeptidase n=1 Tax=Olivibacter sp. XZL3 TaxID=1735116 RepID=UPI0010659A77|nr:M1 family metallopeptidase [Olivibacter sp. XZL3]